MTCIGFALGLAVLHCDLPAPAVPVARFCELYQPVRYPASTDPRVRRRLRELNAEWRAVCSK